MKRETADGETYAAAHLMREVLVLPLSFDSLPDRGSFSGKDLFCRVVQVFKGQHGGKAELEPWPPQEAKSSTYYWGSTTTLQAHLLTVISFSQPGCP